MTADEQGVTLHWGYDYDYPEHETKPPKHHDHHKPKPPKPTIPHVHVNPDGSTEYELMIVTDLDRASRAGEWLWRAVSRKGRLTLSRDKKHVNISWEIESEHNLTSSMNVKGRAMELSGLSVFHNRILTPDDRTGMISEIRNGQMIPWVFLNSGPGNTTNPFKCEWMTIKDDLLYVGSHGNEYVDKNGKVLHRDNMWIKTVTPKERMKSQLGTSY
ncbi:Apyrase [Ostertagia ostertagi]